MALIQAEIGAAIASESDSARANASTLQAGTVALLDEALRLVHQGHFLPAFRLLGAPRSAL